MKLGDGIIELNHNPTQFFPHQLTTHRTLHQLLPPSLLQLLFSLLTPHHHRVKLTASSHLDELLLLNSLSQLLNDELLSGNLHILFMNGHLNHLYLLVILVFLLWHEMLMSNHIRLQLLLVEGHQFDLPLELGILHLQHNASQPLLMILLRHLTNLLLQ